MEPVGFDRETGGFDRVELDRDAETDRLKTGVRLDGETGGSDRGEVDREADFNKEARDWLRVVGGASVRERDQERQKERKQKGS